MWTVNGHVDDTLARCVDLDIQATPFTNTLPIRRLRWVRRPSTRSMSPTSRCRPSTVTPARQRYTALAPGSLYRFEGLDTGFMADLPVDQDGLVLDYPGLFRRLV